MQPHPDFALRWYDDPVVIQREIDRRQREVERLQQRRAILLAPLIARELEEIERLHSLLANLEAA